MPETFSVDNPNPYSWSWVQLDVSGWDAIEFQKETAKVACPKKKKKKIKLM